MKKITCLLLALILMLTPILETYAVATNAQQIKYNSETPVTGEGGVKISKTISPTNIENYFDITLKVQTKEIARDQDIAIVIVMDISNSMIDEKVDANTTRLRAALTAGKTFINDFATNSAKTNSIRKLGYVAFNTNATQIFDIQSVNTQSKATSLSNTMESATKTIVGNIDKTTDGYKNNDSVKYTNIEAGLKMAEDMLYSDENKDIENKYIILISDGFPTTYIQSGYNGYINRMDMVDFTATKENHYQDGVFYDEVLNKANTAGCDYSDKGAKKAQDVATRIKNKGTVIYSIGTGLTNSTKTIDYYANLFLDYSFSTVDRTSTNYVIGAGNSMEDYKKWLGGTGNATNPGIGSGYSSGHYIDTSNLEELTNAYKQIFANIEEISEAYWVTNDPINSASDKLKDIIGFLGIYDNTNKKENIATSVTKGSKSNNTASYNSTTDSITWDLKKSNYKTTQVTENGNKVTYYEYELKYRIRLKNENSSFIPNASYDTNGTTALTYVVKKTGKTPELKTIEYQVPKVEGYLGTLTFNKISNYDGAPLANTSFKLVHDIDNCECKDEKDHLVNNYYLEATSNSEGVVTFIKIPSGHTYKLVETATDEYHNLSQNYQVTISYGLSLIHI